MGAVAHEDEEMIAHIEFICARVHDFGDELYEGMMERDHDTVKSKAQDTINTLSSLIQSLTEEI
jgi:methyl coenzyme M reductase subunit D|tara:strand:- start:258 stop:449 length:192 start_codon:yes stop_codon:yes gene_type:complete